jgi:hypothetical protein
MLVRALADWTRSGAGRLEDFRSKPHLLSQHPLQRMAFLSKFVRGALAGLATAGIGGCPSRRGSGEKASG